LRVAERVLDWTATKAALRIDLLNGKLHAVVEVGSCCRTGTGQLDQTNDRPVSAAASIDTTAIAATNMVRVSNLLMISPNGVRGLAVPHGRWPAASDGGHDKFVFPFCTCNACNHAIKKVE
jgi:hypothetical protein